AVALPNHHGAPAPDVGYVYQPPVDIDNRSTDEPPYAGQYPGLHLNLPLEVQPGVVNNLFISDQPEEIRDDRKRDDGTSGATGVYSAARVTGGAPLRVLMDQSNATDRPLKLWLVWVADQDGVVMYRSHGAAVHDDSVLAGAEAFEGALKTPPEPRLEVKANTSVPLEMFTLAPPKPGQKVGQCAVVQDVLTSTAPGQIFSVITEADQTVPPTPDELAKLPVLHNIRWGEEAHRLQIYINPETQPTRFTRILESFQHARGRFHYPDRVANACYDADSFADADYPVQAYSLFESIPGEDKTTGGVSTQNRGSYGAQIELKLTLEHLPKGCHEGALLVLNPGSVWGGRHIVSDGKTLTVDSLFLYHSQPGLLRNGQAATLWRGEVKDGTTLTLSTEPMANTSVALWYMFVPVPPAATGKTGTAD
ncbi:MAG TPA: hypothetical protein VGO93_10320, partial [Candidatus Xenobia bacterium]